MRVASYEDETGRRPFDEWFDALPADHAAKVARIIQGLEAGHDAGLKGVGEGVLEWRIDWGPGLRLYLARDGKALILLLGGGTKRRQSADITAAQTRWRDYKRRKARRK